MPICRATRARRFSPRPAGDQYIGLEPGGSDENLKDSDPILTTASALVLEKLIGQVLFSKAADTGDNGNKNGDVKKSKP